MKFFLKGLGVAMLTVALTAVSASASETVEAKAVTSHAVPVAAAIVTIAPVVPEHPVTTSVVTTPSGAESIAEVADPLSLNPAGDGLSAEIGSAGWGVALAKLVERCLANRICARLLRDAASFAGNELFKSFLRRFFGAKCPGWGRHWTECRL